MPAPLAPLQTRTPTADDIDTRGYARVAVEGGGAAGISTITVTQGELVTTVDLVLHGQVDEIVAEAEQSAIEVGGKTFIVVTATDSAGNPVADLEVSVKGKGGVTPPAKLDIKVSTADGVNKDTKGTVGKADKGDIPSCNLHADPEVVASPGRYGCGPRVRIERYQHRWPVRHPGDGTGRWHRGYD